MSPPIAGYKRIFVLFVEVVVFLFSAFGGFLKQVAPPEPANSPYVIGMLSFLTLLTLMTITAVSRSAPARKYRRAWITFGVICFASSIVSGFVYPRVLNTYTYGYPAEKPTETHLKGSDSGLTEQAQQWVKENSSVLCPASCLERKFPRGQVWTAAAIEHAQNVLLVTYAWLVLSLATAVFALMEANVS